MVMLLLIIGGVVVWWNNGTAPVNPYDKTRRAFSIKKGAGVREVTNDLKTDGLIRDPIVFFLLVKQLGLDGKIQAGDFRLSPSMSAREIADALQVGTSDIRVTIAEGKRAEEIADLLKDRFRTYDPSWRGSLNLHEGYLFPDTYSFPKDASIDLIISTMRDNFEKKYASIPPGSQNNLSKEQIVNIASMVEREARLPQDRPLVASVIINRLNIGMALQIDATIQYALGYDRSERTWWKKNLTINNLKIISPFNTYENAGLPPGPISNPGLDVLTAVATAPDTSYLFYISDKQGHNHYAKTLSEHNENIKKYGLE